MHRTTTRGPIVAALAVSLALFVLVAPVAAVGSVSTGSQVAEDPTTHRFTIDPADAGTLSAVEVDYRSDADLERTAVSVGIDVDGDGDVDEQLRTAGADRGDRGLRAGIAEPYNLTGADTVVVTLRGVRNPSSLGTHTAVVAATVDGATDRTTVTYRVTPFRSDDATFRDVSTPGSTFERAYASGATVADARLVAVDWRAVTLNESVLEDVSGVDDEWVDVEFADTTATAVRTERTAFDGVDVSRSALSDVRSTDDDWRAVEVTGSSFRAVDSRDSTYDDVRFREARVDGFSVEDSTLEDVAVRPAAPTTADEGNRSDLSLSHSNGTLEAAFSFAAPEPKDHAVDTAVDDVRGADGAPNGTVEDVTLRDATLRNVTVADGALVDVRVESATLRNVTFDNVTLRGVTLSDATYADGTISDELITSEEQLRAELLVEDAGGTVGDTDVATTATVDPTEGNLTVDDGGVVENTTGGLLG